MAAVLKVCVRGKTSGRETGWRAAAGAAGGDQGDQAWLHSTCILKVEPKGFAAGLGYAVGEVGLLRNAGFQRKLCGSVKIQLFRFLEYEKHPDSSTQLF